jgi:ubiquinol-cytochrome c reductase cytochrome b subunit
MNKPYRTENVFARSLNRALVDLPAPVNISYWWNYGSLLGLCLVIQIITGLFLAIHYTAEVDLAFSSCIHISREVNFGWLIRSCHANGASFFFLFLYLHIGRGLYYGSYELLGVWLVGVLIYVLTIGTAFLGYVLVWGQIRLWAATVITSLLSAIPIYGGLIVEWIWGGFSVRDATLHRFFVFHFLLPFILVVFSAVHLIFLHLSGSRNPLGINGNVVRVPFHPYFTVKDILGIFIIFFMFGLIVLLLPDLFAEPENYIPANPLVTPNHIKPEWYFLWLYAILRAIPNKLGGVVALFAGILVLGVFPFMIMTKEGGLSGGIGGTPFRQFFFWCLVGIFIILRWLGSCPAEEPFNFIAQMSSIAYFMCYFFYSLWNNARVWWVSEIEEERCLVINGNAIRVPFHAYFTVKDILGIFTVLFIFALIILL